MVSVRVMVTPPLPLQLIQEGDTLRGRVAPQIPVCRHPAKKKTAFEKKFFSREIPMKGANFS